MTEQEYQDKLKVRQQLSQFDRLRLLEHEFDLLLRGIATDAQQLKDRTGIIRDKK